MPWFPSRSPFSALDAASPQAALFLFVSRINSHRAASRASRPSGEGASSPRRPSRGQEAAGQTRWPLRTAFSSSAIPHARGAQPPSLDAAGGILLSRTRLLLHLGKVAPCVPAPWDRKGVSTGLTAQEGGAEPSGGGAPGDHRPSSGQEAAGHTHWPVRTPLADFYLVLGGEG